MFNPKFIFVSLAMTLLAACSTNDFTSKTPEKKIAQTKAAVGEKMAPKGENTNQSSSPQPGVRTEAEAEGVAKAPPTIADDKIAAPGLSLDLHAIVDVSGSLTEGILATDPKCSRLAALKSFFSNLRTELGPNPDARLSLTVFSSSARFIGTDDKFLELSDAEFDAKYKSIICQSSGRTNAAQAFEIAAEKAKDLMQNSPKKTSSVLIFTDGIPNVVPMSETLRQAEKLREVFPNRVFGVLLGQANLIGFGSADFLTDVTGSEKRVRRVGDVNDLANALSSFLK